MKIGLTDHIDIYSDDIEDVPSGNKTGGVQMDIEGEISLFQRQDGYVKLSLYLSRKECKELIKLIRDKM